MVVVLQQGLASMEYGSILNVFDYRNQRASDGKVNVHIFINWSILIIYIHHTEKILEKYVHVNSDKVTLKSYLIVLEF